MAISKQEEATLSIDGRQVLEFHLLDDQDQQELLRCIQEKKKVRIVINEVGSLDLGSGGRGYNRLID